MVKSPIGKGKEMTGMPKLRDMMLPSPLPLPSSTDTATKKPTSKPASKTVPSSDTVTGKKREAPINIPLDDISPKMERLLVKEMVKSGNARIIKQKKPAKK